MNRDLFESTATTETWQQRIGPNALVLHGFALADEAAMLGALQAVVAQAPFRHMVTPGGFEMSVAMSNCGPLGWVSDRSGYRYDAIDPLSGKHWPPMPPVFMQLAKQGAAIAGFADFSPDACLVNCYQPGARLTLHQDKDERDFSQPIVSVSLGLTAMFLFGGLKRSDKSTRISLMHGDVVVWGSTDRLRYHGVLPLKPGHHHLLGNRRINLTFRKAC